VRRYGGATRAGYFDVASAAGHFAQHQMPGPEHCAARMLSAIIGAEAGFRRRRVNRTGDR